MSLKARSPINERTIRRTCQTLCEHGFLHKENNTKPTEKDESKKEYESNTWCFTSKLILRYWKSWADFNEVNQDILPPQASNLMIKEIAQSILDHVFNALMILHCLESSTLNFLGSA